MNTNASTQPAKRDPVRLGNFTYTALPERAEFRPALSVLLAAVFFYGGFALVSVYIILFVVAPWSQDGTQGLWFSVVDGMILGGFATLMVAMTVYYLRFWRHPTTFDYAGSVFRRGGREVCHLSDIGEIRLRRITDPQYPYKAKIGLAVGLRDGSTRYLDQRPPFLNNAKNPFTNLGELETGGPQEAARSAAAEVAARLGVPLKEQEERGRLTAPIKGGPMG